MGPHDKKHISKKYFDHRKSNIPKGPWGLGDRKIFCQNFQNKLDIRSPQGVLITKNKRTQNQEKSKKWPPRGDSSPNPPWGELALGHAQCCHSKSGQCDTRGVTVHHKENSLQYSKGSVPWHHLQVSSTTPFLQCTTTYSSIWQCTSATKGVKKGTRCVQKINQTLTNGRFSRKVGGLGVLFRYTYLVSVSTKLEKVSIHSTSSIHHILICGTRPRLTRRTVYSNFEDSFKPLASSDCLSMIIFSLLISRFSLSYSNFGSPKFSSSSQLFGLFN